MRIGIINICYILLFAFIFSTPLVDATIYVQSGDTVQYSNLTQASSYIDPPDEKLITSVTYSDSISGVIKITYRLWASTVDGGVNANVHNWINTKSKASCSTVGTTPTTCTQFIDTTMVEDTTFGNTGIKIYESNDYGVTAYVDNLNVSFIPITAIPTNIASTTGNFWVNTTWSAGTNGNSVTDSYNVSVNDVWTNGTTNTYTNSTLSAHAWQNVTVYGYNFSTGISGSSVTKNTQVPNSVPTVPVISYPSNNSRHYNNSMNFTWNQSTDSDSDTVTYHWQQSTSQIFATITNEENTSNLYSGAITITDGTINYLRVRSNDSYEYSSWSPVVQFTENTAPSVVNITLSPSSPGVNDNLTISMNTLDAEVDALINHYLWYKNGILQTAWNDSTTIAGGSNFSQSWGNQTNATINTLSQSQNGTLITSFTVNLTSATTKSSPYAINTTGLVGWWKMDENTGTLANDSSGNNNNGTKNGSSLSFDGTDDYIYIPNSNTINSSSFSVSLWLKPNELRVQGLAQKLNASSEGWRLFMSGGAGVIEFDRAPGEIANIVTPTLSVGQWYHVSVTYDSSTRTAKIFLNGEFSQQATDVDMYNNNTGNFLIAPPIGNYFNGTIDDVRIYNRPLSSTEIAEQYNGTYSNNTGLTGLWHFKEGSGQTVADDSGNSNTGTLGTDSSVASDDPTWSTSSPPITWTTGKYNSALSFNGMDDYINATNSSSLKPTSVTVIAWINATSFAGKNRQIVSSQDVSGTRGGYALWVNTTGILRMAVYGSGSYQTNGSGITPLSTGRLYQVAGTYDGNTISSYINGTLVDTYSTGGMEMLQSEYSLRFGNSPSPGVDNYYNGTIDEVQIYNRSLSAEEVRQDYLVKAEQLRVKTNANSTWSGYWNSSTNNPLTIPYTAGETITTLSYDIPSQVTQDGVTIYNYNQSAEFSSSVSITNSAGNFIAGDSIYVKGYASDGYENSSEMQSNTVIIGSSNSAPALSGITLNPSTRKYNKTIFVNSSTDITDTESAQVQLQVYWYNNSVKTWLGNSTWSSPPNNASVSITIPWSDGLSHTIYAQAQDSGNVTGYNNLSSSEVSTTFTSDITAPNLTSSSLSAATITIGNSVTVTANADGLGANISSAIVRIERPDATTANWTMTCTDAENSTCTKSYTATSDVGTYYIRHFYITDESGNTGTYSSDLSFNANTATTNNPSGGGGGPPTTSTVIIKESNETTTSPLLSFKNILQGRNQSETEAIANCLTESLFMKNACSNINGGIIVEPFNWWVAAGAYLASVLTIAILMIAEQKKREWKTEFAIYGTITVFIVAVLVLGGFNMYLFNYIADSPKYGWTFASFMLWGATVTVVGDYMIYKKNRDYNNIWVWR